MLGLAFLLALIPLPLLFSQSPLPANSADNGAAVSGAPVAGNPAAGNPGAGMSTAASVESSLLLDEPAAAAPGPGSPVFAIFRMVLVLALVAALIYAVVFFIRRLSRPQTGQNPHLKILASTHLGNGRYVHVVSVGKKAWLIGSGEGGVNHIADIEDQESVDAMLLDGSRETAEGPVQGFQALLAKFSSGARPPEENSLENIRRRRERFKRL